jgi:hypothetical protein
VIFPLFIALLTFITTSAEVAKVKSALSYTFVVRGRSGQLPTPRPTSGATRDDEHFVARQTRTRKEVGRSLRGKEDMYVQIHRLSYLAEE